MYKTYPNCSRENQEKVLMKEITNIKCDEINIMNSVNDNTFNLHDSLLNNDNRSGEIVDFGKSDKMVKVEKWIKQTLTTV